MTGRFHGVITATTPNGSRRVYEWRFGPEYAVVHGWDNRFRPAGPPGVVLTDDLNTVDVRSEKTMMAARRELREYFGRMETTW